MSAEDDAIRAKEITRYWLRTQLPANMNRAKKDEIASAVVVSLSVIMRGMVYDPSEAEGYDRLTEGSVRKIGTAMFEVFRELEFSR